MKRVLKGVLFAAALAGAMLWAAGVFDGGKVEPGRAPPPLPAPHPSRVAAAERATVAIHEDAVGTVESRRRVVVSAQVTARVLAVSADAGAAVAAGEPLVVLDDREPRARLEQAREARSAADAARERARQAKVAGEAHLAQAQATHKRVQQLLGTGAATQEAMDVADAELRRAQAEVDDAAASIAAAEAKIEQAKQVVAEAEVALGHARIAAPIDGVVAERSVEPGDLAWPGRPLLVVLDPRSLRLVALVREGLISRVERGAALGIRLDAVGRTLEGRVAEVIPGADPLSRTFRVRVDFDAAEDVHPGMFGRLRLPVGEREVVRVAEEAVERVGQLETVRVRSERGFERRLVTTGVRLGDGSVEVLSGLAGGETVALPEAP
jgi:multidrug efflux pump subunit AcrA (membrane-fusion protein)